MQLTQALEILEIQEFTGIDAVKAQFRKLAHEHHPDKNPNKDTSEQFRQIMLAYEFVLNNITDVFTLFDVSDALIEEETAKTAIENLDDIFEDIFGFSKSGRVMGYQEPQILYLKTQEFACGVKKKEKLVAYTTCPDCVGAGAERGTLAKVCTYCFGRGMMEGRRVCPKCQGRGRLISRACQRCQGFGRLKNQHVQEFDVPTGLIPFEIYTLDAWDVKKGQSTQLFIEPRPYRDPIFQIDKYNLLCEYHVDFLTLTLPLKLKLTTPLGPIPLHIELGAKAKDQIRISGQGLYKDASKKRRGDLIVTLMQKESWFNKVLNTLLGR